MERSWKRFKVVVLVVLLSSAAAPGQAQDGSPDRTTTTRSAWPMYGFNVRHTSHSTTEHALGTSNVSTLQLVWSRPTGTRQCCASPIVSRGGTVLVPGGDYLLHAFDADDGAVRWTSSQQVYSFSGSISGSVAYFGLSSGAAAFRVSSGKVVWSNEGCDGEGIAAPPTIVDGTFYAGLNDPELVALDAETGACRWQALPDMGTDQFSSPSIVHGTLYIGDGSAQLWSADATDGRARWHAAAAGVYSGAVSTVVATRRRVYASASNVVGAYKASTGVRVWAFGFGETAEFGPPAFANGVMYVGLSDGHVYALDRNGDQPRWTTDIGPARTSVSVANGVVYAASDRLYAIDARTGKILWSGAIGPLGTSASAPAIANAMVYVEGLNGRLYAFGLPN
jgi:outer membrane protein assembly factor BamB